MLGFGLVPTRRFALWANGGTLIAARKPLLSASTLEGGSASKSLLAFPGLGLRVTSILHSLLAFATQVVTNCDMKKTLLSLAVWYFVVAGNGAQVGPFATQAACESYRTQVANDPDLPLATFACFSTTAKN
jgi:hypothetical protein